jgi:hypothetical protein
MGNWESLSGRERQHATDAVWAMVQATYAKIGLIVDEPRELYEYDDWELFGSDDRWIAFVLNKTTPFGQKLGLAGSDGSRAGRSAVKEYVANNFFEPGHYAEVSHRMEDLAVEARAPVVCAAYAGDVLKKNVLPAGDGLHYRRSIKGVGEVTKVLIGLPRGVPVTSSENPQCPVHAQVAGRRRKLTTDRSNDAVFAHALSIVAL